MPEEAKQWVAVTVLVQRGSQVLSMQRAASQKAGAGLWEGVSGRVQAGEDPLATAEREVREESGLEVQIAARPIATYAAMRGDEPMTVIVFHATHVSGEVQLSPEHDAFQWVSAAEFRSLGAPSQLAQIVEAILTAERGS